MGDTMRRFARYTATIACLVFSVANTWAASRQDWQDCEQQKDHPLAIEVCTRILSETGLSAAQRSTALVNRGNAYDDTEKPELAIVDYTAAIALNANNNDAYFNRGITYRRKKEFDRAIADFDTALRLNPNDADALYYRGRSKNDLGDKAGGDADIAAARKINPDIGK